MYIYIYTYAYSICISKPRLSLITQHRSKKAATSLSIDLSQEGFPTSNLGTWDEQLSTNHLENKWEQEIYKLDCDQGWSSQFKAYSPNSPYLHVTHTHIYIYIHLKVTYELRTARTSASLFHSSANVKSVSPAILKFALGSHYVIRT